MKASTAAAIFMAGLVSGQLGVAQTQESPRLPAERVTGIGGVFFKARDPKGLGTWSSQRRVTQPRRSPPTDAA